eukprot:TRINITY_DN51901_c0_g1_i1.p1 TRINITY_DN51901_c0_g1~~TRINITY_DN51901_c0_g1_i1.p1  ORF type:complete len:1065 (+),score=155.30 TRINITY_DN51901_c0_g1_i1:148-3342(+)
MVRFETVRTPGKLAISIEGVAALSDLSNLDVRCDVVSCIALGEPVSIPCDEQPIDVDSCQARFKKGNLILTWRSPETSDSAAEPVVQNSTADVSQGYPKSESQVDNKAGKAVTAVPGTRFVLKRSVDWALQLLGTLTVPEAVKGLERFKAEVGLAELALYASRCCRLGVPTALRYHLKAAEDALHEALAQRAKGCDEDDVVAGAMEKLRSEVQRSAGAVESSYAVRLPSAAPLGHSKVGLQSSMPRFLAEERWRLRDGTHIGPGIGTWKLSPQAAEDSVAYALQLGVRHVDTAAEYGTEAAVYRGLQKSGIPRGEVFVNLKVAAASPEELSKVLQDSLLKWGGGPVDCIMLHQPPPSSELLLKQWSILEKAVENGHARLLGASNVTADHLHKLTSKSIKFPPAIVQLKCSVFHQGGYFVEGGFDSLWRTLREHQIVAVGISLFNTLHSCVDPLQEPLIDTLARDLGCSTAELLAGWACHLEVCPLIRCSTANHARQLFQSKLSLPAETVAALSSLASLTETAYCTLLSQDPLGLRQASGKRVVRRGDSLTDRWVQIHNINTSAEQQLNGRCGQLVDFSESTGLWQVRLASGDSRWISAGSLFLFSPGQQAGKGAVPRDEASQMEAAGRLLQALMATGGFEAMQAALQARRDEVSPAFAECIAANLQVAEAKGFQVKVQVFAKLLSVVRQILEAKQPVPDVLAMPSPALDAACLHIAESSGGSAAVDRERLLAAAVALLETEQLVVIDNFASETEVSSLARELGAYEEAFQTAKIWVGRQAAGAELSAPAVRSDRVFWVCGEHHTHAMEHLWDSAGMQPASGLAACRPEVVMTQPTSGFPELKKFMHRMDNFILKGVAAKCLRLQGIAERSDAMISIYEEGARFQKHIDNPNRDGRVLTSICYLNDGEAWTEADGGELRVFAAQNTGLPCDYKPEAGRLVLFYADEVPHEVLPARRKRMALTYWWFDRGQRLIKNKELAESSHASPSMSSGDEAAAQDFIAKMLSEDASPAKVVQDAKRLSKKALAVVADVVGAQDGKQALEGLQRLSSDDLQRLRGSMGKMGLS